MMQIIYRYLEPFRRDRLTTVTDGQTTNDPIANTEPNYMYIKRYDCCYLVMFHR